jgi:UDP-GlcNAc:undecaprenyl-phosphate/decaprenyl-phosphate GlcNAc-1-phosphate transferase
MRALAADAGLAFLAGLVLVPLVRTAARRFGIVARPQASRWHQRPTPLLGGVAVGAIVLVGGATIVPASGIALTLACAAMMLGLGLVDDLSPLKSSTKLVYQIVVASIFVYAGHRLEWTSSLTLDTMLTLAWIVGITNALNLLDNMDGLASGVGVIACVSLLLTGDLQAPGPESRLLAMLLGALIAFLLYNLHPASIFMGDSGSLMIGMILGAASVAQGQGTATRELLSVVAAPVLVLFIPIFDTTLVVVARLLSGRRPSEGGRDHSSHRMVAMGLSESGAVGVLWTLAAVGGVIGVAVQRLEPEWAGLAAGAFVVAMALFAAYLAGVRVYDRRPAAELRGITPVVVEFMYKRRVLEVLLDVLLVSVAFYCAHRLRFDSAGFDAAFVSFLGSLPVVIACQIPIMLILGAYRGMWRYFGLMDGVVLAQSVVMGAVASAAVVVLLNGRLPVPTAVYVIHAALLFIFITSSRASFVLLTEFFRRRGEGRLRAVIFEADPAQDMATHRLVLQGADYRVLGFFVDSPDDAPSTFEGYPRLGDYSTLLTYVSGGLTDVVIVGAHAVDNAEIEELAEHCNVNGVALVTLRYALEPVDAAHPDPTTAVRAVGSG